MQQDGKWYTFEDYPEDYLNARIAYWEGVGPDNNDWCGILNSLYDERDRRVDEQLLAWVEQK